MVRAIEQIEQDIATLEQAIAATAEECYSIYSNYLVVLGQAVRQQLVLASYHLCTQAYPQRFLALSYSQRQQLQKALKQLAQKAQEQLQTCDQNSENSVSAEEALTISEEFQAEMLLVKPGTDLSEASLEIPTSFSIPLSEISPVEELGPVALTQPAVKQTSALAELMHWREGVEQAIVDVLRVASLKTNLILEQAGILPTKVPEPVLEVAAKSEMMGENVSGVPNILKVLIETATIENVPEKVSAEEAPTLRKMAAMQVIAVNLRLGDIEFADATVMPWRNKLRNLSSRLSALEREYQKKQFERAIAEAETVWRQSWSD